MLDDRAWGKIKSQWALPDLRERRGEDTEIMTRRAMRHTHQTCPCAAIWSDTVVATTVLLCPWEVPVQWTDDVGTKRGRSDLVARHRRGAHSFARVVNGKRGIWEAFASGS